MLLDADAAEAWKAGVEPWLNSLRPLVLFGWLFNNSVVNAMTEDGLRVDLVPHAGATIGLDRSNVRVLFQREDAIHFDVAARQADTAAVARTLLGQAQEFWRCIALTPTVIGRDELIVSVAGLTIEISLLTDFIILGNGIVREGGIKRLNAFLPDELRQRLEALLSIRPLTRQTLADAHLRLAEIMREYGPPIAARHGFAYPDELERAVRSYVGRELDELGIDQTINDER